MIRKLCSRILLSCLITASLLIVPGCTAPKDSSAVPTQITSEAAESTTAKPTPSLPDYIKDVSEVGAHTIPADIVSMDTGLPKASYDSLPEWRGFNLLNKFNGSNIPFEEKDFETISELGYNYVRLPMDYQMWIYNGDWNLIDESTLEEIDKAVEYGIKYGIHVDINFHRAPGYTVAVPQEEKSLWTDPEAQQAFASHWRMFARRYKGISGDVLSFNLVNEPANVDGETYAKVMGMAVEAIRGEDPDRLIIADGLEWAGKPVPELVPLKVAQSFHSYNPFKITHYKASWVEGADNYPQPQWPPQYDLNGYLYGSTKAELQSPLVVEGDFSAGEVGILIGTISIDADIAITADGVEVFRKKIVCGDGEGEWEQAVYSEEWGIYQNIFNKEYTARIPEGTKRIEFSIKNGDWLTFSQINIRPDSTQGISLNVTDTDWGRTASRLMVRGDGTVVNYGEAGEVSCSDWLISNYMSSWRQFADEYGIGIMVGEWGVHNQTPHGVTLRLMEDMLKAFNKLEMGWSLWNFNGSFGIVNSGREDVQYEDFEGYSLDRDMSELLLKYK